MDTSNRSSRSYTRATTSPPKTIIYSAPASPTSVSSPPTPPASAQSSPASGGNRRSAQQQQQQQMGASSSPPSTPTSSLSTPKKHFLDAVMLHALREKLRTPRSSSVQCELHALQLSSGGGSIVQQQHPTTPTTTTARNASSAAAAPLNIIKNRYLISTQPCQISAAAQAKTPASYRHLIDLSSSNLRCTDVFTERQYLCKIINEPLHKVQRAYFQLAQAADDCRSAIYGHALIRGVHDLVALSAQRTYVIIASGAGASNEQEAEEQCSSSSGATEGGEEQDAEMQSAEECAAGGDSDEDEDASDDDGVYEDLHTYIRNKRRLGEPEARALFHQICQTVQVCHRNGIILRDLKLKRFYFIDAARTKLQYESLEGSMILDEPADDTLSDKIGCPLYTAPELLCPHPTYQGKPADMWSLGVILYTMLVGQYPFYEKGNCNLITIIRHCHVQIPQTLSRSVRWLLLALLRKQYEERMCAEHIFHTPWLREQLPYYFYIPADVVISDDEEEEEEAEQLLLVEQEEEAVAMEGSSNNDVAATEETTQPLDYTRHALLLQIQEQQEDVEMMVG